MRGVAPQWQAGTLLCPMHENVPLWCEWWVRQGGRLDKAPLWSMSENPDSNPGNSDLVGVSFPLPVRGEGGGWGQVGGGSAEPRSVP